MISDEHVEDLVDEYLGELSGREGAYMFTAEEASHDVIHRKVLSFMTTKLGLHGVCITLETEADFLNLLQHIDPSKVHFINKFNERQNSEEVKVTLLDDDESIEEITKKLATVLAKTNSKFVIIKSIDKLFARNPMDAIVEFVEKLIMSLNSAGISVITIAKGQQMTSNLVTKTRHDYNKTIHL